jgi:hypothetical protein
VTVRYFGPLWVLLYDRRYWCTCVQQWPTVHRTDDGWFARLFIVEFGTGSIK